MHADLYEDLKIFAKLVRWFGWRSQNVVDAMEESIVSKHPPARILVGIDAKYVFAPLRLLRSGMGFGPLRRKPACMQ